MGDLVMEEDGPNMTIVNIKIKSVITKKMSKKRNEKFQTLVLLPKEKQSEKISEAITRKSKRCRNFFLYTKMLFSIVQEENKILIARFIWTCKRCWCCQRRIWRSWFKSWTTDKDPRIN